MRHTTALSMLAASCSAMLLTACATTAPAPASHDAATAEVMATERAFAKTMADRDHAAFTRFLADETVFFNADTPLRGKAAVAAAWQKFYAKPAAPFSWEPDHVVVLASGTLALSTGPVHDPDGKLIARFNSIWRREPDGQWRIVFDRGNEVCAAP